MLGQAECAALDVRHENGKRNLQVIYAVHY